MKKHKHIYSIDYYAYQSNLKKYHPTFKLLFTISILFLCLWTNHIATSIYISATMMSINILKNQVSFWDYSQLLKIPCLFIILACIAIAAEIGYDNGKIAVSITKESIYQSITVMLRTFGAVNTLYFLTLSTPIAEIIRVLKKTPIPNILTELMFMIYRYIFILTEVQLHFKHAAQSRLGYIDFKTSCYTFGNSMANLLIVSFQKANKYYDAMLSRCYNRELLFLYEKRIFHIPIFIGAVLYGVSIIFIDILCKGIF